MPAVATYFLLCSFARCFKNRWPPGSCGHQYLPQENQPSMRSRFVMGKGMLCHCTVPCLVITTCILVIPTFDSSYSNSRTSYERGRGQSQNTMYILIWLMILLRWSPGSLPSTVGNTALYQAYFSGTSGACSL